MTLSPQQIFSAGQASFDARTSAASLAGGGRPGAVGTFGKEIFFLGIDGVLDSVDELTAAGVRTLHALGVAPEGLPTAVNPTELPEWLLDRMGKLRPLLEVEWQIPVLIAILFEQREVAVQTQWETAPMTTLEIMLTYPLLTEDKLKLWKKTEQEISGAFVAARDNWMADDMASWLAMHRFYKESMAVVQDCRGTVIMVTSMQQKLAILLLRYAGLTEDLIPDDRILGLGMYVSVPRAILKFMTLAQLRPECVHCFEDRWQNLVVCLKDEQLTGVKFYFGNAGVSPHITKEDLAEARRERRVQVVESFSDFRDAVTAVDAVCTERAMPPSRSS